MTVDYFGRAYRTVAERLVDYHTRYTGCTIHTSVFSNDGRTLIMRAEIRDCDTERVLSTGHAQAHQNDENPINKLLEKAETTAVGRALAFLDADLMGEEIASADEVSNAVVNQKVEEATARLIAHNDAWKRHEESIHAIKEYLAAGNLGAAWEALNEIPEADLVKLRIAPTKGGWMTVAEKKALEEAKNADFDPERGVYKSVAEIQNEL